MASSSSVAPVVVEESSLTDWKVIGCGGFGQIYKARHHEWCREVAIKLLHYGTSASLQREIKMMRQGSSPNVIQVLGVFQGRPPSSGPLIQLGLVMEFMERGSLAYLQDALCGTPPWPLVFRLAHQVALGVNFLHSLSPALLHLDLKPSNVLLDPYLNAKLTDFGLARFYRSVTRVSKKDSEEQGGSISYMPPEAFAVSYSPTRASDIYSYGILLWSIVTGKQPYANAMSSIVRFRIPEGDRPSLDEIRSQAAGIAGLTGLMNLMERCWNAKPNQRPSSHACTTETEELYKMHKHAINDTVHQVLKKLNEEEEQSIAEQTQRVDMTRASANTRVQAANDVPTGRSPVQEVAGGWTANQREQTSFEDPPSHPPASLSDVDLSRSVTDHKTKLSSAKTSQQAFWQNQEHIQPQNGVTVPGLNDKFLQNVKSCAAGFERQFSSPDAFRCHPPPAASGVCIHMSHVTGFQFGNNNNMRIYATDPTERRRHQTAPSSVNLPPPHLGGRRDNTGGD